MLNQLLPAPKHSYVKRVQSEPQPAQALLDADNGSSSSSSRMIPSYPLRKGFVPTQEEDFGDGGAYPEIHVLQYPLKLGKPGARSSALVPVVMDETGSLRTDMIVRQGTNKNKLIQSTMSDLKGKAAEEDKVALPDEDETAATAEKTRLALEALINGKIKSTKSTTMPKSGDVSDASYIRYTPNPNAPGQSAAAKQRVIKMVEAQVDPLEPPKHKQTKVPRGPPSPPVPVLHSPPRKITVEDQQAWKVPPCVSNWKNARGFIIPLDKRLAADGRGLQEVTINNKFATMSEALYIAERKATEDLKLRNEIRKKIALKEKEDREAQLRIMANQARLERAGALAGQGQGDDADDDGGRDKERVPPSQGDSPLRGPPGAARGVSNLPAWMTDKNSEHHVSENARGGSSTGRGERDSSRGDSRSESPPLLRRYSRDSRDRDERDDSHRRRDQRDSREHDRRGGRQSRDYSQDKNDSSRSRVRRDSHDFDSDRSHAIRRSGDHKGGHSDDDSDRSSVESFEHETEDEKIKRQQRERLRLERRKERERELRIENMKGNMRKNKIDRDEGRDISEKIALGMLKGTGRLTGESMYDSRLFNQSAGMDSGFGADDDYGTYTKPLFDKGDAGSSIYRPKKDSDQYGDADVEFKKLSDTSRFKPDKGFIGADSGPSGAGSRNAPVQFEKAGAPRVEDPFGIDDLVKKRSAEDAQENGKRQRHD